MKGREAIAIHEAAHAVAAVLVGRKVLCTSIKEHAGDDLGRLIWGDRAEAMAALADDPAKDPEARWWADSAAVVSLAGPIGERRYHEPRAWMAEPVDWAEFGGSADIENATTWVRMVAPRGEDRHMRFLNARAIGLLLGAHVWDAVRAVASALMMRELLVGPEIERIVAGAGVRRVRSGNPGRGRFDPTTRKAPNGKTFRQLADAIDEQRRAGTFRLPVGTGR